MYISTLGLVGLQNTISKHFGKPMKIEQRDSQSLLRITSISFTEKTQLEHQAYVSQREGVLFLAMQVRWWDQVRRLARKN